MFDIMSNDSFNVIKLKNITFNHTNYFEQKHYLFESPNVALHALVLS
jgi:hypothetical protein